MKSASITKALMSILLLCCITFSYGQQTNVTPAQDKFYQDYKSGGIEKALQSYNKSGLKGDEYTLLSEPLNQLGYRLMGEGDLEAAEKAFLAQIDEYPNEANPYDSYADLLMEKGDENKAKQNYQKAIELSSTMQDVEEKAQMLEASKSKLAKLEGKGEALRFLDGNWSTKTFGYKNGEKNLTNEGSVTFTSNEDQSVLTGTMKNKNGVYQGSRMIAYDAIDDEYDMVFIGNSLTGIEPSTLKIEKSSPEEIIMIEKFEENGKNKKIKHVLKRNEGEIAWDIHDLSDGQSENQVAQMIFSKKN